jgi:segregation and condensation protein A
LRAALPREQSSLSIVQLQHQIASLRSLITRNELQADELNLIRSDELQLNLDGWEGPLDLLLTLARNQKVDLAQISILALVEQYLTFLNEARALKLEIAADYLVMAAWLAYLKSCLLLPKDPEQDPSPEEVALRLQMRLQRLDAMREAGARLMGRDRIGRDVFVRGAPEGLRLVRKSAWQVRDFDLFAAYGVVRARTQPALHVVHARAVLTLEEAIERVSRMIGTAIEWTRLESFLPATQDPQFRRSALASSFVAALELARRGRLDIAQDAPFAPISLRAA